VQKSKEPETNLASIAANAVSKEEENDHFLAFLKNMPDEALDTMAHSLNKKVSSEIDCTSCGNCCKSLVINVTREEVGMLADHLKMSREATKEKYIEESQQGNCFINTIPCHFLAHNKCTIYEHRFTECRDFPHLHKPGFKARLPGTLMHYGRCPIIYNVIEQMKMQLGFLEEDAG
jgi:uncharacterized protein